MTKRETGHDSRIHHAPLYRQLPGNVAVLCQQSNRPLADWWHNRAKVFAHRLASPPNDKKLFADMLR